MKIYVPNLDELEYRKVILSDPDTMSYNKELDVDYRGYDRETGCVDFPESIWKDWYSDWIEEGKNRFAGFLMENDIMVGEVALRYVKDEDAYMISIIIEGKHRGKGYGKSGLIELMEHGFKKMGIRKLIDEFPASRTSSCKLFEDLGFKKTIKGDLVQYYYLSKDYK